MIDLDTGLQEGVYALLKAGVGSPYAAIVFEYVPENTDPPLIIVGAIDADNEGTKDDQFEKLTVEIQYVHRGRGRAPLLAMMHAGRLALDGAVPEASGASFMPLRFVNASASSVGPDGVTYAGIATFETYGGPE